MPVRVEFGGDGEAEGGPVCVVGFDDAVDVFGRGEQLQSCCESFVELVAVDADVDVGDD